MVDREKSVHDLLNTANITIPVQGAFRSLDTETVQRHVYRQTLCLPLRFNVPIWAVYAHQGEAQIRTLVLHYRQQVFKEQAVLQTTQCMQA